jgi:hypothetical protein
MRPARRLFDMAIRAPGHGAAFKAPHKYVDRLREGRHLALNPADTFRKLAGAVAGWR